MKAPGLCPLLGGCGHQFGHDVCTRYGAEWCQPLAQPGEQFGHLLQFFGINLPKLRTQFLEEPGDQLGGASEKPRVEPQDGDCLVFKDLGNHIQDGSFA